MILNNCRRRPELEYPCKWVYKVIGMDPDLLRAAVGEVMGTRPLKVVRSHVSSGGRYLCLDVEVLVHSEEDRTSNHLALKRHPHVKMVL